MTTRLIFIRHGITDWNRQQRYCGRQNVGLSAEGKKQAARLRNKLKSACIDRIYASDRRRALQTARIAFPGSTITQVKGLKEIDFGILEGLGHREIEEKYRTIYRKWIRDPFRNRIPQAETMAAFQKRVLGAVRNITRFNRGKTVAVVCHGGTIAIFMNSVLKERNFWEWIPSSASLSIVENHEGKHIIKTFNDTTHLKKQ